MKNTCTYVTLEIPKEMYEHIRKLLIDAEYSHVLMEHVFMEKEAIDMNGIALIPSKTFNPN